MECYLVKKQRIEAEIDRKMRLDPPQAPSMREADELEGVKNAINELVQSNDSSKIDEHYMLFLFKIYESEDGIVNCCQTNKSLRHELLNHYI